MLINKAFKSFHALRFFFHAIVQMHNYFSNQIIIIETYTVSLVMLECNEDGDLVADEAMELLDEIQSNDLVGQRTEIKGRKKKTMGRKSTLTKPTISEETRENVIRAVAIDKRITNKQASILFGVKESTVRDICRKYRLSGVRHLKKRGGNKPCK